MPKSYYTVNGKIDTAFIVRNIHQTNIFQLSMMQQQLILLVRSCGGIQQVCTGSIEPHHGILLEQRSG